MNEEDISLISPHMAPGLYEAFGTKEFDDLYLKYEQDKTIPKKTVSAQDLFFDLLKENNFDVIEAFSYPDHHAYSEKDYDFLLKKKERELSIIKKKKDYLKLSEKFKNKI